MYIICLVYVSCKFVTINRCRKRKTKEEEENKRRKQKKKKKKKEERRKKKEEEVLILILYNTFLFRLWGEEGEEEKK